MSGSAQTIESWSLPPVPTVCVFGLVRPPQGCDYRGAHFAPLDSMSSSALTMMVVISTLAPAVAHAQRTPRPVDAIADEADQAFEKKRFGEALEAFTKASTLAPEDASLWFGKGLSA